MVRGQNQVFAALALVHSSGSDILERALPRVVDTAGDRSPTGGRDLQHDRSNLFRIVERKEVDRVRVRGECLVFPVERTRPTDDLVPRTSSLHCRLVQKLEIDRRHAPDDVLDRPPLDGAMGQFVRREILRLSQ